MIRLPAGLVIRDTESIWTSRLIAGFASMNG
jgi:hypothetical protein